MTEYNTATRDNDVVRVEGLVRWFKRTTALDGVSLRVYPGTVHGLVGENGAGKTTLMEHLLGGYRPQAGTVSVFGFDPVKHPVEVLSRIGYLSEERDIPGWMTVRELMQYSKAFYPDWDATYAEQKRQDFGLDPGAKIKTLSRGERAKAGLLCAIAYRPPLLLLDEPSSGLDVSARRDILEAIVRTVADEGRTVIFSSHLLDEVERVSDNITMIHKGRVVLDGALEDIKARYHRATVRFAEPPAGTPLLPGQRSAMGHGRDWDIVYTGDEVAFRAEAARLGGEITGEQTPTLEDIFLAETGASSNCCS